MCASRAWARALLAGRPHGGLDALLAASDRATAALQGADLDEALAGHPPIGRPAPGDPVSAREQGGVGEAERAELLELGLRYQERFGHVFLIRAAGRTGGQMLEELRRRLGSSPERERETAREELAGINRARLRRLAGEPAGPGAGAAASVSTHVLDTAAGSPARGVAVALQVRGAGGAWTRAADLATDEDGRCARTPLPPGYAGDVRLTFATGPYLARTAGAAFFPEAAVAFTVSPGQHYHVPLLLSPYGYSVYRGS